MQKVSNEFENWFLFILKVQKNSYYLKSHNRTKPDILVVIFLQHLRCLLLPIRPKAGHSFRQGGASSTAGFTDMDMGIQQLARWCSGVSVSSNSSPLGRSILPSLLSSVLYSRSLSTAGLSLERAREWRWHNGSIAHHARSTTASENHQVANAQLEAQNYQWCRPPKITPYATLLIRISSNEIGLDFKSVICVMTDFSLTPWGPLYANSKEQKNHLDTYIARNKNREPTWKARVGTKRHTLAKVPPSGLCKHPHLGMTVLLTTDFPHCEIASCGWQSSSGRRCWWIRELLRQVDCAAASPPCRVRILLLR